MKLVKIYEGILRALSVRPDENGTLFYEGLSKTVPWTLSQDDRRAIVLPTREVLRAAEWDKVAPWHPMSEHLNRGVSPIMRATVRTATIRLTEVILSLMEQFIELGLDTERQLKMAPGAQKVLGVVKAVDDRSLKAFHKIVAKMVDNKAADLSPISLYLKREGLYQGVRSRVCTVSSPLLTAVQDSERKPGGVPIRVNDQTMLESLIEYLLPDIDDPDTYSAPSSSKTAPYFESFLNAFEKVATQLNKVIHLNRKELKDVEKLKINLDWGDLAEDLQTNRSEIPPLEDSKGKLLNNENTDASGIEVPAPVTAQPAPALYGGSVKPAAAPRPTPAPAPAHVAPAAPVQDDANLSMAERIRRRQMQIAPAAVPPGYPPPYAAPPGYPPGYPPAPPAPMYAAAPQPAYPYQPAAPAAPTYHRPVNQQPQMYQQPPGYPPYAVPPGYPPPPPGYGAQPMYAANIPDPNAPPWMGNNSSTIVAGESPAPAVYPGYPYGAPAPVYAAAPVYGQPAASGTPVPGSSQPVYNT